VKLGGENWGRVYERVTKINSLSDQLSNDVTTKKKKPVKRGESRLVTEKVKSHSQ